MPKTCGWRRISFSTMERVTSGSVNVAGFRGKLGMEDHLQQQVAEFFGQLGRVAGLNRFDDFVGFFDHIFAERLRGLLPVPRDSRLRGRAGGP